MAHSSKADPHAYSYESISCACGHSLGYCERGAAGPPRCVACELEQVPPVASTALPAALYRPEAVLALTDAWDHAAARALSGDSSVAIPRALYEAVVTARAGLP